MSKRKEHMSNIFVLDQKCKYCFASEKKLKNGICKKCFSCTGKEAYQSLGIARAMAEWYYKEDSYFEYLTPYRCKYCRKYHLGHNKFLFAS